MKRNSKKNLNFVFKVTAFLGALFRINAQLIFYAKNLDKNSYENIEKGKSYLKSNGFFTFD